MSYTRYQSSPAPVNGRARRRRSERKQRGTRRWRWLQVTVIALLLLTVALVAGSVGTIVAVSRNLPALDELSRQTNAQTTYIYDRNGQVIATLHGAENRTVVPSKAIPTIMKEATVAVEDKRFYEHHGVDFEGLVRALWADLRAGSVVQGGSTITEQFVKQAYVGNDRNITRKIREAVEAWKLEDKWSKDKILTEYLNTSYFGDTSLRCRGGRGDVLPQEDLRRHAAAGGAAGRAPAHAVADLAHRVSAKGQGPPQRGPRPHERPGLHQRAANWPPRRRPSSACSRSRCRPRRAPLPTSSPT